MLQKRDRIFDPAHWRVVETLGKKLAEGGRGLPRRTGQQPSVPAPLASARLDLVQRNVVGKEGKGEALEVGRIESSQHVLPQVVALSPGAQLTREKHRPLFLVEPAQPRSFVHLEVRIDPGFERIAAEQLRSEAMDRADESLVQIVEGTPSTLAQILVAHACSSTLGGGQVVESSDRFALRPKLLRISMR